MVARLVCAAFCAFLASAAGCGGAVKDDPGEQLRTDGEGRCKAACVPVVACDSVTITSADCESSCNKEVMDVLERMPACNGAMLAMLDCFASATCKNGQLSCQAEEGALKDCKSANPVSTSPPLVDTPDVDPGDPVTPDTVTCLDSEASISPVAPDAGGHEGTVACERKWDSCSDGRTYRVECRVIDSKALMCACFVHGAQQMSFNPPGCDTLLTAQINEQCGWDLL